VAGGEGRFNAGSFRFFSRARGAAKNVLFYDPADIEPAFADYIVLKTVRGAEAPSGIGSPLPAFTQPSFNLLFEPKNEFSLDDGSRVMVYSKRLRTEKPMPEGIYTVKQYAIGALVLENVELKLEGFNPEKGVYSRARVFAPYASYEGADIYGLTLDISDLRAAVSGPGISGFVAAGVGSVKVVSAKISTYAVGRFLAGRFKFMPDPELKFDDIITLYSETPRRISAGFSLAVRKNSFVDIKLESFGCEGYSAPEFLARTFTFSYSLSQSPYRLEFESIRSRGALLEIN
jgi:hypothetical protein